MSFLDLLPWKKSTLPQISKAFLSEKKLVLLRAPAGSGKTAVALAYLVSEAIMGRRGAIFFRTKSEIENALRILREILDRRSLRLLVLPTPSKEDFCIYNPPRDIVKYWCPISGCDRINRRSSKDLEHLFSEMNYSSINDYIVALARHGVCPYFTLQNMLRKADIVLGTHQYLITKDLFEKLGHLDIIIVDEAHNLMFLRTFESEKKNLLLGEEIFSRSATRRIGHLVVALWREGRNLEAKLVALFDAFRSAEGETISVGNKIIKILPPIKLVEERMQNAKKFVLMSATLYPLRLFEKLFAGNMEHETLVIPGLFVRESLEIKIIKSKLSMKYAERNISTFKGYAELIRRIQKKLNQKLLIFAPSYEIANQLAKLLGCQIDSECRVGLVTVFRGKLSEGIEQPYNIAIAAGLPFPKITEETKIILEFYSKFYGIPYEALEYAYRYSGMIIALIQALGRVGRKQKGLAIIIDKRSEKYIRPLLQNS